MKFRKLLKEAQFHGAKRLAVSKYRFCWRVTLMLLFCSATTVVWVTIRRYFSDPTYTVNIETVYDSMLFPTVLICPEVSFPDYKMDQFVNEVDFPPSLNATYIRSVLKQLAAFVSPDVVFNSEDLNNVQDLLDYNNLDIEAAGLRLTPSCEEILLSGSHCLRVNRVVFDLSGARLSPALAALASLEADDPILLRCRWIGNLVNCSSIFQMEIARFGYCCVFNGRSLKREMREQGSARNAPSKGVYGSNIGINNALMVAIDQREDLFDVDLVYKWVLLRTGQHFVDITVNGSAMSPGEETWISYDSNTMQVSDDAASLSSDLRKCKMAYEPLKYFPTYHKTYCLLECEMQRTIDRCGCLQVSHPGQRGVPVCDANNILCARRATVSFAIDECKCPATCNVETEHSDLSTYELMTNTDTIDHFYEGLELTQVSIVRVYIAKRNKKILQRKSYFTTFNLFEQLGGVFNVFFGCSILTLLELVMLLINAIRK